MRSSLHGHQQTVLLDAAEVDAIWQLLHQLIEHMHRQVAVRLQIFHSLLTGTQRSNFGLQAINFLDLGFQDLDLGAQQIVLVLLAFNHDLEIPVNQACNQQTCNRSHHHIDLKRLFSTFLGGFAVR